MNIEGSNPNTTPNCAIGKFSLKSVFLPSESITSAFPGIAYATAFLGIFFMFPLLSMGSSPSSVIFRDKYTGAPLRFSGFTIPYKSEIRKTMSFVTSSTGI